MEVGLEGIIKKLKYMYPKSEANKREGEITRELIRLSEKTEVLLKTISRLDERIRPLVIDRPRLKEEAERVVEMTGTEVGKSIQDCTLRINNAVEQISEIIEKIEL